MNTLPKEIIQLIAELLKYEDYLEFRKSCKKVAVAISPLLYTKKLEFKNYLQTAAIAGDLQFLEFLEKEGKLNLTEKFSKIISILSEGVDGEQPSAKELFLDHLYNLLIPSKGISLKVWQWFKDRDLELPFAVLQDNEILHKIKGGEINPDMELLDYLLEGNKQQSIEYILTTGKVRVIGSRGFSFEEAKIIKRYTALNDHQILWENPIIDGDLDAVNWILQNTQIAEIPYFNQVINSLDEEKKSKIMEIIFKNIPKLGDLNDLDN